MNELASDHDPLPASQRVLAALRQARARLEAAERVRTEPIAVVGVGCRFPGCDGPQAFWEMLRDGRDAIREMPAERYQFDGLVQPGGASADGVAPRRGSFLEQIDRFDAEFFGISPREAISLDPQQRLLLEVAWEALEHAGQAPDRLAGSRTGVFVGMTQNDYALLQLQQRDPRQLDAYVGTGGGLCFGPGRLSHVLGLRGPNMAVDTACSSSLLAVHLACQSLRLGECDLALAGGVHLALSRHIWDLLASSGVLSPDGRCRAFDAAANGFGRGEGAGIVVLRKLSDALERRDPILAVIRGSAINHDGASSGLTVPNEAAQQELLRLALGAARLQPAAVDYVEAHGTGTPLGDPIEAGALASIYGPDRSPDAPLLVGSVKSNLGHLEAAAGIAGMIKVVLALVNEQLPAHVHFRSPSPHIPWDAASIAVVADRVPWRRATRPRIAGISSFGMSGANVHVLVEEAPATPAGQRPGPSRRQHLLPFSARAATALVQSAARFDQWLADNPAADLGDVAFTISAGRAHFDVRTSIVADSADAARQAIASITTGRVTPRTINAESGAPKIAMLFTGQGSQYVHMGRQLYETQASFRRTIDQCDELFRAASGHSLLAVLEAPDGRSDLIHQTEYAQPALFALEYALAELLRVWGVSPAAVMGHSIGEYAAAAMAGVFNLEEGFQLVAERGRLMQGVIEPGEMAIVVADEARVRRAIQPWQRDVSIAAINGPRNIVISGRRTSMHMLIEEFARDGVATERLNVSQAFHSPVIEPALVGLERFSGRMTFSRPTIDLISNVSGRLATAELTEPRYWSDHARQTVRFSLGLTALYELGCRIFVECGPKPTLCALARHCLPQDAILLPCLSDRRDDWQQLLETVGQLYERGVALDWEAFHRDDAPRRVALPTYPFQRERYWFDADRAGDLRSCDSAPVDAVRPVAPRAEAHCQYELIWQPRDLAQSGAGQNLRTGDRWLIFSDRTGVARLLQARLEEHQQKCLLVYPGEGFQRLTTHEWSVNPTRADDMRRLLDDCAAARDIPLKAIVHLWSLDAANAHALTSAALDEAQRLGFAAALHLTQTLVQGECPTPLWLATRQAVSLRSDSSPAAGLAQSPLWGLGKVIALEHPEVWGGMVDLPAELDDRSVALMVEQICATDYEDHVAIRGGRRYVARIRRQRQSTAAAGKIRADATYLITGGIGTLGLRVARWLVDQGARHLVLTARRGPSADAQATIDTLEQRGVEVLVVRADAASEQKMADLFQQIRTTLPPLRGVIHAAGAPGYQPLTELDWETACAVLRPKVMGTWLLHQATCDLTLDFFVEFSSVASLWGSKGQAHYAAANSFLDALAQCRRGQGLPGMSVNWGPWSGGGMVTDEALDVLERSGLTAFTPARALDLLGRVVHSDGAQTALADVDWRAFSELFEVKRRRPLLDEVRGQALSDDRVTTLGSAKEEFERRFTGLSAQQCRRELIAWLQGEVAVVLRLPDGRMPDPSKGFFKLGMDSLMAVELAKRLQTGMGRMLPATLAFDFPSVSQLADHLAGEWRLDEIAGNGAAAAAGAAREQLCTTDETAATGDGNSGAGGEVVDRLLAEKLSRLESLIGET